MPHYPGRRVALSLLFIVALLAASLLPARRAAADPSPEHSGQDSLPWRDKGSPFGMITSIGNRVRSDEIDAYVALLRESGVQWAREEFFWHKIQPEPGGPFQWNGDGSGLYDYDH